MKPIRIFISSVQKEFAEERAGLRDYLRGNPLMRRFFDGRLQIFAKSRKMLSRQSAGRLPNKQGSDWDGVGTKSALSRHQVAILHKCLEERLISDLMRIARRTDGTKFRDQVLKPLLDAGLVEMTIPDKPTSSKQKYRLTEKGKQILNEDNEGRFQ